ncbi:MAG TPA: TetR/AcrR family transcriptional regulator [Ktedonobacteraceae bacterium]|nr:TetR/AcrR family transcriptional regulator [Ktedonobacteraceae bacterium]
MALKQSKTQARRAEILKIARETFAEKGFEATTISEIVSRAGIAQGTFYLYFPSKISVVVTLAKEMQADIEQALRASYAESTNLDEMIKRSVESAFQIVGQYRDILALVHSGIRWLETEEARSHIFAPYHALIAEAIRRAQDASAVSTTVNPEVTAVFIVGLIYYSADQCYVYHSSIPPEVYIAEAARFIRQALGVR